MEAIAEQENKNDTSSENGISDITADHLCQHIQTVVSDFMANKGTIKGNLNV